jgi:hypothetical protein
LYSVFAIPHGHVPVLDGFGEVKKTKTELLRHGIAPALRKKAFRHVPENMRIVYT